MGCEFSISITSSVKDIISKASTAIKSNGGDFTATDKGGLFSIPVPLGTVIGNFEIVTGSINVIITQKPFFVSCNKIESTITDYITTGQ